MLKKILYKDLLACLRIFYYKPRKNYILHMFNCKFLISSSICTNKRVINNYISEFLCISGLK